MELVSQITAGGQVTIPAAVRRHLGLYANEKVAFVINPDGRVELKIPKYPDVQSLRGTAGSTERALPWHEMRAIARDERLEEWVARKHG